MAEPRKVCLRAVAIQELHRPPGRPNQPLRLPPPSALQRNPALLGIPMMSISHSDLILIRTERSDAGLSQCETVIDIRQGFLAFS